MHAEAGESIYANFCHTVPHEQRLTILLTKKISQKSFTFFSLFLLFSFLCLYVFWIFYHEAPKLYDYFISANNFETFIFRSSFFARYHTRFSFLFNFAFFRPTHRLWLSRLSPTMLKNKLMLALLSMFYHREKKNVLNRKLCGEESAVAREREKRDWCVYQLLFFALASLLFFEHIQQISLPAHHARWCW
jgi:hypothetical protein